MNGRAQPCYNAPTMNPFNSSFFGPNVGMSSLIPFGAIFLVVILALLALKGYALWTAAKRDERVWFIVLLVVNTAGILELVYLFAIAKKWQNPAPTSHPHHHDAAPAPKHEHEEHHHG